MENQNGSEILSFEQNVPLSEKLCLTVDEANRYSGIGVNTISAMLNREDCPFVLRVGRKRLVKRKEFEEFIRNTSQIQV